MALTPQPEFLPPGYLSPVGSQQNQASKVPTVGTSQAWKQALEMETASRRPSNSTRYVLIRKAPAATVTPQTATRAATGPREHSSSTGNHKATFRNNYEKSSDGDEKGTGRKNGCFASDGQGGSSEEEQSKLRPNEAFGDGKKKTKNQKPKKTKQTKKKKTWTRERPFQAERQLPQPSAGQLTK